MQKVAFVCLHYGSDYLAYAIRSVYDNVDRILVAYSDKPSHGHSSSLVNPDNRQKCYDAAHAFDTAGKIDWLDGNWSGEGSHRNVVFSRYPEADLVCVVDADEIWHPEQFAAAQEWCLQRDARAYKQSLMTPWRSFNWVCHDNMMPDRFYRPKCSPGTFAYVPKEVAQFYHFGYARDIKSMQYKIESHGHKCEWRQEWFQDKFLAWSPTNNIGDLHPTCRDTWNAIPFDKNQLPTFMREHLYWGLDLIV